ncbi:alpha-1B-glycoprotein [Ochotona princeps]|uniref:alpha-1B-glycoprotein n=1 Tax=Ochotona princeps TaxID=9978 RepID=UPI0027154D01|nr:alpha-1B-glycoprotein [Ochotona princeps]
MRNALKTPSAARYRARGRERQSPEGLPGERALERSPAHLPRPAEPELPARKEGRGRASRSDAFKRNDNFRVNTSVDRSNAITFVHGPIRNKYVKRALTVRQNTQILWQACIPCPRHALPVRFLTGSPVHYPVVLRCRHGRLTGLSWCPENEAATFVDPRPLLLAESVTAGQSVSLTCKGILPSLIFQLLKDGVAQSTVKLDEPAFKHQFLLGEVTDESRGLYRCRSGLSESWTGLSNLVEIAGKGYLPPPLLSVEPVSWLIPGLEMTLLCQGTWRGVTFLLRREGDDKFQDMAEPDWNGKATFPVSQAGNYSCSYRIQAAGDLSEPSETVAIEELAVPPPPKLHLRDKSTEILRPGTCVDLECVAPLSGVEFELRGSKKNLDQSMSSTSPDRIFFHLNAVPREERGPYTCRYRLRGKTHSPWSADSAPVELVLSDGKLPAPQLWSELATQSPAPGMLVRLQCLGPRAGLRFALMREVAGRSWVRDFQSPADNEAHFELPAVSVADSGNYSCVYMELAPPFAGSVASKQWELQVDGPPPRPQLRPMWSGAVTPGRDAFLRCEGSLPGVTFELLKDGEEEASTVLHTDGASAELVLPYVGPQHAGNYSCRYRSSGELSFVSELSDPVALLVAGS